MSYCRSCGESDCLTIKGNEYVCNKCDYKGEFMSDRDRHTQPTRPSLRPSYGRVDVSSGDLIGSGGSLGLSEMLRR